MRGGATFQWATSLDMARGSFEIGGTLVKVAVDMNVSKFPTLKAGFVVSRVITS